MLPEPLQGLANYPQFIRYKIERRGEKDTKIPINHESGFVCDAQNPSNWTDLYTASMSPHGAGLGFVFTDVDPFFFVDLDNCLEDGTWSAVALDVLSLCAGAAVEVSQSGQGLHVFGSGVLPPHGCKNVSLGLELYHTGRFVALTGDRAMGDVRYAGSDTTTLVSRYFSPTANAAGGALGWTEGPVEEWAGHTDDDELISHACNVRSASATFGASASFADLWAGDSDALALAFPGDPYDASSADAALASHLAFWTGKDCARMQRLMERSGLVRDKYEREDYLPRTILAAVGICSAVHQREAVLSPGTSEEVGRTFLDGGDQLQYFAGCVYVRDLHRVLLPDGGLLKPEQFKVVYGGKTFKMDSEGSKTSRNAWEAFTESQVCRPTQVDRTMFRPDLPPGQVFDYEGGSRVNNYYPANVSAKAGDVSLFLLHVEKLLPDLRDRAIVLAYMAACVQHIGTKFQWTVLIQGVEGNGKTLLSRVVAASIGMRHVHSPRTTEVSSKFNSWIKDRVFAYVEDVYLPESKREVLEALKPIITNDWQPVEPKGVDQTTEYVVCNIMLNSNHKDAIKKTRNDRRFAVFYTAQQEFEHLARDGMQGDYFPALYKWLKNGGYGAVTHFLQNYDIPEKYNPALRPRAPITSSTEAAIECSMGSIEQDVLEAAGEEQPGFAGGWVSSMALDEMLEKRRLARFLPPNKRRELMQSIGYDLHPALKDGRVNNVVMPDRGKPRLYIKVGHIHTNLATPSEVAKAYAAAQRVDPNRASAAETFA